MILRGSSRLPKISRDGFETIEIFEDCTGSAGADTDSTAGAVPVASASPAIGTGSGDSVRHGVGSTDSIEGVEIAFEFSKDINKEDRKPRLYLLFPLLRNLRV